MILGKVPRAGFAKVRLSPPLQPEEASALYGAWLRRLVQPMPGIATYFAGYPVEAVSVLRHFAGPGVTLVPAPGDRFGARCDAVIAAALTAGHAPVAVRGTDAPDAGDDAVRACLSLAAPGRLVLAPDQRDGFWCVVVSVAAPQLFASGDGNGAGRAAVAERAAALGLEVRLGPSAWRVDSHRDLAALWLERAGDGPRMVPR